jgi:hypothetical protein
MASAAFSIPGGAKWRSRRQIFQSRKLVAQQLVLDFQPGVFQAKGCVFVAKLNSLGLEPLKPRFRLLRPLQQTRHQTAQRIQ